MAAGPDELLAALQRLTAATDKLVQAQQADRAAIPTQGGGREAARRAEQDLIDANNRLREPNGPGEVVGKFQGPDLPTVLKKLSESIDKLHKTSERAEGPSGADRLGKLIAAYRQASAGTRMAGGAASSGNIAGALEGALGAGRGFGAAAGAAGGAAAGIAVGAGAIVGLVAAAVAFKHAMDEATKATISHYRELGKVSGAMAAVMAQRDVREMMREREKGDRLAGVAGMLTRAEQDRKDASKELEIAWEELKGGFLTEFNRTMTEILKEITVVSKWAKEQLGIKDSDHRSLTLGRMAQLAAKDADEKWARHRTLNPPVGKGPGEF